MEIRRKVKNVVYKYSEAEKYVREATSNDPWGPTTTLMSEIADMTQSFSEFESIMQLIWKRLNDKGKNWRHVYKSLVLLDYLVKCGSDKVAEECLQNIHTIETLKDFQYFEDHKDLGIGIREKSKSLVVLLKDREILEHERSKGLKVKEKFQSNTSLGSHQLRKPGQLGRDIRKQFARDAPYPKTVMKLNFDEGPRNEDADDEEFQRAIELSKEEHERSMKIKMEEERREDLKIKLALEQSKKEDEVLAILRPPPKASDKQNNETLLSRASKIDSLYKLSEASRIFEQENGDLNSLDANNVRTDPWESNTEKTSHTIPLDFDPWKSPGSITASKATMNNNNNPDDWLTKESDQSRNIIDDIFGDDKPNAQFASNWNFESQHFASAAAKDKPLFDPWQESDSFSFNQSTKNKTGSLDSLTDIARESSSGDKMLHSCSVMDLLDNKSTSNKKKTPQEFLGENSNLVNFENLVPIPKAAAKNPFCMSNTGMTSNPFHSQVANSKIPMNQIFNGNQNASQFASSGNLSTMEIHSQFNNFSTTMQPNFPISHSQYQGFSNVNNFSNIPWSQTVAPIPNQWAINTNTANPFFH